MVSKVLLFGLAPHRVAADRGVLHLRHDARSHWNTNDNRDDHAPPSLTPID
jgi:hypothetical protein